MSKIWMVLPLAVAGVLAAPVVDTPAGFGHWSREAIGQVEMKLDAEASTSAQRIAVQQLADYPNESMSLVHRIADGQAEWHETQVDVIIVQSGSATLLVGGTLVNGETTAPHEKRNGTIEGGSRVKLAAGDIVRIPPRTPHQLLLEGSKAFDYIVIKVKGY
ncbi:MAG: cupin domain-containing protein [Candidatus Acidiferrales bacterium]